MRIESERRNEILEMNQLLRNQARPQDRVREIHPEVCLAVWNNGRAMHVLEYSAGGMSEHEVLGDFPQPTRNDIRACLAYAAERERRTLNTPAA